MKKVLALLLAASMVFTSVPTNVYAASVGQTEVTSIGDEKIGEVIAEEEPVVQTPAAEESEPSGDQEPVIGEPSEDETPVVGEPVDENPIGDEEPVEDEDPVEDEEDPEDEEVKETLVSFALVMEPYVNAGETASVIVGIGEDGTVIDSATLTVRNNSTGAEFEVAATEFYDALVKFDMTLSEAGEYSATKIVYEVEEVEFSVNLQEIGIEAKFGINAEVETEPDFYIDETSGEMDTDTSAEVIRIDENGSLNEEDIETAIGEASVASAFRAAYDCNSSKVVVVLDPGHGGSTGGQGGTEDAKNLKIGLAARDALKKYNNVDVYMTRETDKVLTLEQRVDFAKSKGATVLVSLHLNVGSSSVNGAEVYYPNGNYRGGLSYPSLQLANKILEKLSALGLTNRGAKIRNSENNTRYEDGSLADYYGIIRLSKIAGFAGIIIEHAYMTGDKDKNFLSSDANLKALGEADAKAIAEYFGLTKGGISIDSAVATSGNSVDIKWTANSQYGAYHVWRKVNGVDNDYVNIKTVWSPTANSYTDESVKPGQTVSYKLSTRTNGVDSELSSSVTVYVPQTVTIKTINSAESKKVKIEWTKTENTTGYEIWGSSEREDKYIKLGTVSSQNTESFVAEIPSNTTKYYFKVRAYKESDGNTNYGNYSGIKTGRALDTTEITKGYSNGSTKIKLGWKKITNASGYYIYRSTSQSSGFVKVGTVTSGTTTTYMDSELTAGTVYYYKVMAYATNGSYTGTGSFSETKGITTVQAATVSSATATDSTSISIKWGKIASATGYKLYRSTSQDGTYSLISTVGSNATIEYTDSTVEEGISYYYYVVSINTSFGEGKADSSNIVTCATLPAPVLNSVTNISNSKLNVAWTKVEGATKYQIYRSTSEDGIYKKVAEVDGNTTNKNDKNCEVDVYYYYKVKALNDSGSSSFSSVIKNKTIDEVSIQGVKGTKANIYWTAAKVADKYQIYKYDEAKLKYVLLKEVSGSTTNYNDTKVVAGNTYKYKVKVGRDIDGTVVYGRMSSEFSVTILTAPTGVTTVGKNGNSVEIKWNAVEGIQGYYIYRMASDETKSTMIKEITSADTVSFTDKAVTAGKTYYYKICTYKNEQTSGTSSRSEAIVLGKASITAVDYEGAGSLRVKWNKVENATGYLVYRSTSKDGIYTTVKKIKSDTDEFVDTGLSDNTTYYYKVKAFTNVVSGECTGALSAACSGTVAYAIMGNSLISAEKMVSFYKKAGKSYPAYFYKNKGAKTIEEFVAIVIEESAYEGVRAEVVWAQIILETGYLQFEGCQVKMEQCNFSGLGATDDGACGATFPDIATGVRAQVQHLKGYASKEPLNAVKIVDPRWEIAFGKNGNNYRRGVAPTVDSLGNGNWATDKLYAGKLISLLKRMKEA